MDCRAKRWLLILTFGLVFSGAGMVAASEPNPQQAEFLEKQIRPLLEANCFECHSHKRAKNKGPLAVDSLGALLKGGDSGPALVPGQPEKSLLIKAIHYENEDLRMPPKGK